MALQDASQRPSLLTHTQKEIIAVLQTFLCDQSLLLEGKTPLEDVLPRGGLDSLAMLRLKHSLEERLALKIPIPITILFEVDTVEALELELLKLSISNNASIVMTFSATGSRLPVFLFPPGGGEVNAWLELIKYLPDRPLYAFRLKGLQPGEDVFDNMEDITDFYASEIRALQPNGPYAFLGICFGGLIAFEVAKQFEATGETVAFIGGIDIAPDFGKMRFDALRFFIVDILVSRRLLTTKEAAGLKLDMQSLRAAEFPQKITARYSSRLSAAGVTLERLTRSFEVFSGVAAISETYQPSGLSSNYHAFWATPLSEWQIDDKKWSDLVHRWSDFAPDVTYHRIEGNHYTALTRAHVEGFQRLLNQEFTKKGI